MSAYSSIRCTPALALAAYAFALSQAGCAVYDPSLLDSALSASLSSAGDSGSSGGAQLGDAGPNEDAAGSLGTAAGGGDNSGGGADGAGAGDGLAAGAGGSPASSAGSGAGGAGGRTAGSAGSASGLGGSATGSGGSATGAAGTTGAAGSATGAGGATGAAGSATGAAGSAAVAVELATSKKATASSFQTGNEIAKGNDGNLTTKWCASAGTFPQWWRVDLGAVHTLSKYTVTWEHPDRKYTYIVETSQNDTVYALQSSVTGTGSVQSDNFKPNTSARYVRVTVTDGAPNTYMGVTYPTWASFFEFSVKGL